MLIRPVASSVRVWGVGLAYLLAFLLLDWVSYIRPFQGMNVTPWNPQPALAVALLLWSRRQAGLVWLSLVTAEVGVRGVPSDWYATLAATAALTLSYAAIARAASLRLDQSFALATRRDLFWFAGIVAGGALLNGTVYLTTLAVAAHNPQGLLPEAIARYWVGDAVGMAVFLPMLLVMLDAQRRRTALAALRNAEWWLIAAIAAALLVFVFSVDEKDHFKFFYLLFVPVVWAAARFGIVGAVLCAVLTQGGLIAALENAPNQDVTVFEIQVLMAAMAMTGLMLGVTVDERERAGNELKGSLKLVAAGHMAAALAHELSQPLTALNQYAQAARILVDSKGVPDAERLAKLTLVSSQMGQDARRASDIVKRLRDFFRAGGTQLELASLAALLDETTQASSQRAGIHGTTLHLQLEEPLPMIMMDPVQIAVVLRNVVANAIDATSQNPGHGTVTLRAGLRGDSVLIEVLDNGPGVSKARQQSLFEAGPSDKPGGMGVGLSICRAIVEAHGGLLWAQPGPSGHFCFTLPVERSVTQSASYAS